MSIRQTRPLRSRSLTAKDASDAHGPAARSLHPSTSQKISKRGEESLAAPPEYAAVEASELVTRDVRQALAPIVERARSIASAARAAKASTIGAYTLGYEIELHHAALARLVPLADGTAYVEPMDKVPLFTHPFLNGVSDTLLGTDRSRALYKDIVSSGAPIVPNPLMSDVIVAIRAGLGAVNVIEVNTVPFLGRNTREEKSARQTLKALDRALREHAASDGPPLRWDAFLQRLNRRLPAGQRLQVPSSGCEHLYLFRGHGSRRMLGDGENAHPPYYPQINLSASLEAFGNDAMPLEAYLLGDTAPANGYPRNEKTARNSAESDALKRRILERSRTGHAVALLQEASAWRNLADAREPFAEHGAKERPRLDKLRGFVALLGMLTRTETLSVRSNGSPKNRYLLYLKNKPGDVRAHCLSDRDRALLEALSPEEQSALIEAIAEGRQEERMFVAEGDQDVSVRAFLASAFGFDETGLCDAPRKNEDGVTGTTPTQAEDVLGAPHRKRPLDRIVLELRSVRLMQTLDEVFEIVDRAHAGAGIYNRTRR